jgi:hypothetical protein
MTLSCVGAFCYGWYGAVYTFLNSAGEGVRTGTLQAGNWKQVNLCDLPSGCYTLSVSAGSSPEKVSWKIETDVEIASGGAPTTVGLCTDGLRLCRQPPRPHRPSQTGQRKKASSSSTGGFQPYTQVIVLRTKRRFRGCNTSITPNLRKITMYTRVHQL